MRCALPEFCVTKLQATALWDLPYSFYYELVISGSACVRFELLQVG
jgi:hypothetical protein